EKIRENERAQQQVKRLLDGLEMIDFNEWIELAGSHGFLRRLLVSQWQQQMSDHHSSLRLVQERLVALITRFREQQASAQLVRGMVKYLRTKVDHQWQPYAKRSQVPTLMNVAASLSLPSHPEIQRLEHQQLVAELVAALPRASQRVALPEAAMAVDQREAEGMARVHSQVKQAAGAFYLTALEQPSQALSAMEYWQQQAHPWQADIWLFQVYSEYQRLPLQERKHFYLKPHEVVPSRTNELMLVRDYTLTVNR